MTVKKAIEFINKRGALLVFPIKNRKEPLSLWKEFFPRKEMVWEWDESADDRVGELWQLMKELSSTRKVVYSKWYQGRATFFSKELFQALLAENMATAPLTEGLSLHAGEILETLEQDSPLSTKELKIACDLTGKINATNYNAATRDLFRRMLIVGFGEKEDGVFPSAMMGATQLLFEEIWREAQSMSPQKRSKMIEKKLGADSAFRKFHNRNLISLKTDI